MSTSTTSQSSCSFVLLRALFIFCCSLCVVSLSAQTEVVPCTYECQVYVDFASVQPDNPNITVERIEGEEHGFLITVPNPFAWKNNWMYLYADSLRRDLSAGEKYVDFDFINVNCESTKIHYFDFSGYWRRTTDPYFGTATYSSYNWHGFKNPGTYRDVMASDWTSFAQGIGVSKCTRTTCFGSDRDAEIGQQGDKLMLNINNPAQSYPKMFSLSYPLEYKIRNFRFYDPNLRATRWDVHFANPMGWDQVYCYTWSGNGAQLRTYCGPMPGTACADNGETWDAAFMMLDDYPVEGIVFSDGNGQELRYLYSDENTPVNGGIYGVAHIALAKEDASYADWQQVFAYDIDGKLGDWPGVEMIYLGHLDNLEELPEIPDIADIPHSAPVRKAAQRVAAKVVNGDLGDYTGYVLFAPAQPGTRFDLVFSGRDANGNEVGRFPEEGSTAHLDLGDNDMFVLSAEPSINDVLLGIEDVSVDDSFSKEYYNLQGIRIQQPIPGQLVITRQCSHTTKSIYME